MGILLNKLFKKESAEALPSEPGTVYMPITGKVISMEEIGDGVFSEGILGPGCGIEPAEELVCAPFAGTITQVAETRHAIGICSKNGMELLIHVGMDTVDMNGNGFITYVKMNDVVERGQKLMKFSLADIKAAGHPAITAVILCNADDTGNPQNLKLGDAQIGDVLMTVSQQ
ncbi:PTS sugar transporter subunit IIA [Anaerocolumna xylanovorans]|uniref:PTS system, glucose-specific IIA component n=1 Tax=Anaerocolumna xylanovorans DSM 12503 TaxID=1121345 RepID=A0A1M7Y0Z2_9FIRM|nr:PTS glucose transporter subunit IIA [Anaerocolumna xylanovorans]SHO45295.1 PTS system, glucose-specific IIA component [Anaerocolumna xylanovorans DSM 12503]